MTSEQHPWVRLSEALCLIRSAGIDEQDCLAALGRAALNGQIAATGFVDVHTPDGSAASCDRARVSQRMWRVLVSERAEAAGFERFARGDELHWTLSEGSSLLHESWRAVLLDRPSFECWLEALRSRAASNVLQDFQIDAWIADCGYNNQTDAWEAYRANFGQRAGKREAFRARWRSAHPGRRPGRPPKNGQDH